MVAAAAAVVVVALLNEAAGGVGGVQLHSEAVVLAVAVVAVSDVADIAVLVVELMVALPLDVAEQPQPSPILPAELAAAGVAIASTSYQCSLPAAATVASVSIYHCTHQMKKRNDREIPPIAWPFGGACSAIPVVHRASSVLIGAH